MSHLFKEIESCNGKNNCFRKIAKSSDMKIGRPIVFSMHPKTMRVMVITEQPRGDRVNKEYLKRACQEGDENSIPKRLKKLLGDEFCKSVEREKGIFYWTHYIKCPGEFRKLKKMKDKDKCADTYLGREIKYVKPSLIISIGVESSKWILKTFLPHDDNKDWKEYLWKEISAKGITKIKVGNRDTEVIFLIHPSERSGIGWFIDKKLFENRKFKDRIQKPTKE
jgi:uracil-DNA glycosylase